MSRVDSKAIREAGLQCSRFSGVLIGAPEIETLRDRNGQSETEYSTPSLVCGFSERNAQLSSRVSRAGAGVGEFEL